MTSAQRCAMPGAGFEPACPRAPDFKSGASDQFRHPGAARVRFAAVPSGKKSKAARRAAGAAPPPVRSKGGAGAGGFSLTEYRWWLAGGGAVVIAVVVLAIVLASGGSAKPFSVDFSTMS